MPTIGPKEASRFGPKRQFISLVKFNAFTA